MYENSKNNEVFGEIMNISQEKIDIIKIKDSHIKINAGPGTGKSKFLIHFIKERIKEGTPVNKILVLMFNKSAKIKFEKSLLSEIGSNSLQINTIHGYAYQLFNQAKNNGLIHNYHIGTFNDVYLQRWFRSVLKEAVEKITPNLHFKINQQKLENFYNYVSLKRNQDFSIPRFSKHSALKRIETPVFELAYNTLQEQFESSDILPLNEVVAIPALLFNKDNEYARDLKEKFDYILIDEAQDLSEVDFMMVKNHLDKNTKLIAVGDNYQSINQFRGANSEIFNNLDKILPRVCNKELSESFRYSNEYSQIANRLFNKDSKSFKTNKNKTDATIEIERYFNENNPLISKINEQGSTDDTCLILRERNAFPVYELMLLDNDIDYDLNGKSNFLFHKPISMLLGYLLLATNQPLTVLPFNLQNAILKAMLFTPYTQSQPEITQWLVSKMPFESYKMITNLNSKPNESSAFGNIPAISKMIKTGFNENSLVSDVLNALKKHKCMNPIFNNTSALLNQSALSQVRLLEYFKSTKMTVSRLFELVSKALKLQNKGLKILTIHESKGHEFNHVFVGALVDGILPLIRTNDDNKKDAVECEKKLFFVAMTRAIKKLTLLCPLEDNVNNFETSNIHIIHSKTSRFIPLLVA